MTVILTSNVSHSVHAARALYEGGLLTAYYGPLLLKHCPQMIPRRLRTYIARRTFAEVADMPLKRQLGLEIAGKIVRSTPLSPARKARVAFAITDRLSRISPGSGQILHSHTGVFVTAMAQAKDKGAKIIADHRACFPGSPWLADPILEPLMKSFDLADYILVASEMVRREFVDNGYSPQKVLALPLGVDSNVFLPTKRPNLHNTVRLLFVGRLTWLKGLDTLAETATLLGDRYEFRLVGPTPDSSLRNLCLPNNVTYLGGKSRLELILEYQAAHLTLLPSRSDSFGLSALESMSCGTPVVVTTACGIAETVSRERSGRVINTGSAEELAEAILDLTADEEHLEEVSKRARQAAILNSWEVYGKRLLNLYSKNILAGI